MTKRSIFKKLRSTIDLSTGWWLKYIVQVSEYICRRHLKVVHYSPHKRWSFPLRISSVNVTKSALRIWSHLLKKSLMENFIFCAVVFVFFLGESGKKNTHHVGKKSGSFPLYSDIARRYVPFTSALRMPNDSCSAIRYIQSFKISCPLVFLKKISQKNL